MRALIRKGQDSNSNSFRYGFPIRFKQMECPSVLLSIGRAFNGLKSEPIGGLCPAKMVTPPGMFVSALRATLLIHEVQDDPVWQTPCCVWTYHRLPIMYIGSVSQYAKAYTERPSDQSMPERHQCARTVLRVRPHCRTHSSQVVSLDKHLMTDPRLISFEPTSTEYLKASGYLVSG